MRLSHVVVIGASAGGVEALWRLAETFPPDFPAPVLIVLHIPAGSTGLLPQILARRSRLPAKHAEDGEEMLPGHIYVARPDYHLLVSGTAMRVVRGPRENRHRPAIDPLFRSASTSFGPNAIAVVLSGTLDDGTAGLAAIKQQGGTALVQDTEEAMYTGMPQSAIDNVEVDRVLSLRDMVPAMLRIIRNGRVAETIDVETSEVEKNGPSHRD